MYYQLLINMEKLPEREGPVDVNSHSKVISTDSCYRHFKL